MSEIISEMRINDDATASLFLERERTEVVIDLDRATTEIQRAIKVRQQWQGRENLIAALDLTTPGQAVVRLHAAEGNHSKHKGGIRKVSLQPGGESGDAMRNLLTGLDVGTSKVCAIVGESLPDGQLATLGYGIAPCTGLRKGVVVNIEATVDAIRSAVEEAEKTSGVRVGSAVVGVAGPHIKGLNSHGIVAVRGGEVSSRDVDRVIDAARAVAIPLDRQVLHILPQQFAVDEQEGVREPLRDGGSAAGGAHSYRDRGAELRPESHQVLRARGRDAVGDGFPAAGVGGRGAVSGGTRARSRADRRGRRHHRHHRVSWRRGDAHGGAAHGREPSYQRYRRGIAHADFRSGAAQDYLRRGDQPGRAPRRDGAGAGSRRTRTAGDRAPLARGNNRAADGRDFRDGAARADPLGGGRRSCLGRGAGGRHLAAGGHAGTGRAHLRRAGAARTSDQPQGAARRTDEADVHDGGRDCCCTRARRAESATAWEERAGSGGCARGLAIG